MSKISTEEKQKEIEYIILLLLGSSKKKKLSHLHIQKEIFLLKEATFSLNLLFRFIKHYRGPYSNEIADALKDPMFLDNCWSFSNTGFDIKYSGGYVFLTDSGKKEYKNLVDSIYSLGNDRVINILAGMNLIHDLYDNLSPKELLYIVYNNDDYKGYTQKSIVSEEINKSDARARIKKKYFDSESLEFKVK